MVNDRTIELDYHSIYLELHRCTSIYLEREFFDLAVPVVPTRVQAALIPACVKISATLKSYE